MRPSSFVRGTDAKFSNKLDRRAARSPESVTKAHATKSEPPSIRPRGDSDHEPVLSGTEARAERTRRPGSRFPRYSAHAPRRVRRAEVLPACGPPFDALVLCPRAGVLGAGCFQAHPCRPHRATLPV